MKQFEYKVEQCRRKDRAEAILNEYGKNGWRAVSVAMGDLATRYEIIFEREIEKKD